MALLEADARRGCKLAGSSERFLGALPHELVELGPRGPPPSSSGQNWASKGVTVKNETFAPTERARATPCATARSTTQSRQSQWMRICLYIGRSTNAGR